MMTKLTKTIIYKTNLLLLFILSLGFSGTLYATQNDVDDEKNSEGEENNVSTYPSIAPSTTSISSLPTTNGPFGPDPKSLVLLGTWVCDSIQNCQAFRRVIKHLFDWQKVCNLAPKKIVKHFAKLSQPEVMVSAYHHVLDKHLGNKERRGVYSYINKKAMQAAVGCDIKECNSYIRNQRIRDKEVSKSYSQDKFLQDFLDNMHTYLVHGYDSGHRYRKLANNGNYKVPPQFSDDYSLDNDQDEFKNDLHNSSNELAQESWITIAEWKKGITQQQPNQDRSSKFYTNLYPPVSNDIAQSYKKKRACLVAVRFNYWRSYKNSSTEDKCYGTVHHRGYLQKDLYVEPTYKSLKHEILAKGIPVETWLHKIYEVKLILAASNPLRKIKANKEWGTKYDVKKETPLTEAHLLAILFYTNFTPLCAKFIESFRSLYSNETLKKLIKRNSKFHYLAKYLREVVDVFGTQIGSSDTGKVTCYHGITATLFLQQKIYCYAPLSTSARLEVPTLFTNKDGFTVALTQGKGKHDAALRYFNVGLISCFSAEHETLFMGGCLPLRISYIYLSQISTEAYLRPLFIVDTMLRGEPFNGRVTDLDIDIYKQITSKKEVPFYPRKIWNQLRNKKQSIKVNMAYIHSVYPVFIPELFSSSITNLLLLHKLVKLFPNLTNITSEHTDNLSGSVLENGYSSDIVDDNFIIALKNCLSMVEYNSLGHQLKTITISTTWNPISCDLYVQELASLGWAIQVDRSMQIRLTKKSYDVIWKDIIDKGVIPQIKGLIKAGYKEKSTLNTISTIPLLGLLVADSKSIPFMARKAWDTFSHSQKILEVNMSIMYKAYPLFIPVFFSSGKLPNNKEYKNLLVIDQITQLFPKVAQIKCIDVDRVGPKSNDYSPNIVSSAFIYALLKKLKKISKHYRLQKIMFTTSFRNPIKAPHLDYPEFKKLQWNIGKGQKTIVVTRRPYPDCIEKIGKMISGQMSPNEPTSLDVLVFKQLRDASPEVPSNMQENWAQFKRKITNININTEYMYQYYNALASYFLCLDSKHKNKKNLLLVNNIMSIFPSVTKITCIQIDYVGRGAMQYNPDSNGYSISVVNNFMKSLAKQLTQITHSNLEKITMTMGSNQEKYSLHTNIFKKTGWNIQEASNKKEIILKRRMYHDM